MARISLDVVEQYKGNGGGDLTFFRLKDDGDTARVRFMYESVEDVIGYVVHRVKINDKNRYIECIRKHDEPVDECPLCAKGDQPVVKFFIPLYDVKKKEVMLWERGKNFHTKLDRLCRRFKPLVSYVMEVERVGKAGDQKTTYETYDSTTEKDDKDVRLADLPPVPTPDDLLINLDFDEMEDFIDTGELPASKKSKRREEKEERPGPRRGGSSRRREIEEEEEETPRRGRAARRIEQDEEDF